MAHPLRAQFAPDLIAEVMPPVRDSGRVVVLCDGFPTKPSKTHILEWFARKGYWAVHPRYRGTWESGGKFLERSPHEDILDVVHGLGPFEDLWTGERYEVKPEQVFVLGSSFGGAAALLAAQDERVHKVVALSPVVDWTAPSEDEPIAELGEQVRRAFGEAYRFSPEAWAKLHSGTFFQPVAEIERLSGEKICIIHAQDDRIVASEPVANFARHLGCEFALLKRGGHLSSSNFISGNVKRLTKRFLKK